MSYINHADIMKFAESHVDLPASLAKRYRKQADSLNDELENHLKENPDFSLRRAMHSGSLAKGTALKDLNDVDIAYYIKEIDNGRDINDFKEDLKKYFKECFPSSRLVKVEDQKYSIKVSFNDIDLAIDVVPVRYQGALNWDGDLVSQDNGEFLKTNIPQHRDFIKKRKRDHGEDFARVVRLLKFWIAGLKSRDSNFRFKSFMVELILAHRCDNGCKVSDYPDALQNFFNYIIRSKLKDQIVFDDYYDISEVKSFNDEIKIIDPVNPENNVAASYTDNEANDIIQKACEAGDAISSANWAIYQDDAIRYWEKFLCGKQKDSTRPQSQIFTEADAKYLASKVATDLDRIRNIYNCLSEEKVKDFYLEMVEFLKSGYFDNVQYGFVQGNHWVFGIEYTLQQRVNGIDQDPGDIPIGKDIRETEFRSFMTHSHSWWAISDSSREIFKRNLPFERGHGEGYEFMREPVSTRIYSVNGRSLVRTCF